MDKNLYIGDFRVRNCSPYGEFKAIKSLEIGDEVKIQYDTSEKLIFVLVEIIVNNNASNPAKKCVTIGELEMPVHIRKIVVPVLMGSNQGNLFDCKVSCVDDKQNINNRLRVSIWAK